MKFIQKVLLCLVLPFLYPVAGMTESEQKVPLSDPFVLLWEGTYYAYGTYSVEGVEVWCSDNLKTWKRQERLALHKDDSWGDRWFWAPEVYHVDGKFYMYYSAEERICVAVSDSPLGPFVQREKRPMIENEKCIDNSMFMDDDGKAYLFFDRFNDGLNVWVAELTGNLLDIRSESMRPCIHVSQEWEKVWPRVNEGPFVHKHKGVYYMIYSANSYESPFYGIGFATASTPAGPWEKYTANPILQNPGKLVGVGHGAIFADKKGHLRLAFHAHNSTTDIHPREMYISRVRFCKRDGQTVMRISRRHITALSKSVP